MIKLTKDQEQFIISNYKREDVDINFFLNELKIPQRKFYKYLEEHNLKEEFHISRKNYQKKLYTKDLSTVLSDVSIFEKLVRDKNQTLKTISKELSINVATVQKLIDYYNLKELYNSVRDKWTEDKIKILKDNYLNFELSQNKLSEMIGISKNTIVSKMKELGIYEEYSNEKQKFAMSQKDIDFLKNNYDKHSVKELSEILKLDTVKIRNKLFKLNLIPKKENEITDDELNYIKNNYYKMSIKEMSKVLGYSETKISNHLKELNLKIPNRIKHFWTKEELIYINENINILTIEEISDNLNIPKETILKKVKDGKYLNYDYPNNKLKKEEIDFILDNYLIYTDNDIAKMFNVSERIISDTRKYYGIQKTGSEINGPTKPEKIIMEILEELSIKFLYNKQLEEYRPDFYIEKNKLIIEVQGDYFHCNPYIYTEGPKDEIQLRHIIRDYYKKCYYLSRGYEILYLWENDIINDLENVKSKILTAVLEQN
jgi:very-short-patch-repair endonuclease/biotin operon repressor